MPAVPSHQPQPSTRHRMRGGRAVVSALLALTLLLAAGAWGAPRASADGIGISVSMLSSPQVGVPFTLELAAHGGTPPYTWSVVDGALPAGLTLLSTGEVAGTPQASDAPSTFTVRVVDAWDRATQSTITLSTGRWTPPMEALPTTSITEACEAELSRAFRLPVMRLCERFQDPGTPDLSRYIIGSMLERLSSLPAMLWMP
jgi:hypothetical protein